VTNPCKQFGQERNWTQYVDYVSTPAVCKYRSLHFRAHVAGCGPKRSRASCITVMYVFLFRILLQSLLQMCVL